MSNLGSGDHGELTYLDIIGLMSFFIGLQNLDLNVTQEDAQQLEHQLNANVETILNEIHSHLEEQDKKLDMIMGKLSDGSKRDI